VEKQVTRCSFTGTRPHSEWLSPLEKGFVLTGRDLLPSKQFKQAWKEAREPMPLETSVPGLFAAGDVRAGAMNRVASAVGEGSMAVRLAFDYLAHTRCSRLPSLQARSMKL
jgi:thioredoxin reductase (NADPH)